MDEQEAADLKAYLTDWIREYSDHFALGFHQGDPTLLRPYCHVPALRLGRNGVVVVNSYEEHDALWGAAHEALRPLGYHDSKLVTVDVTLVSPAAAFITVDCIRTKEDGSELMRFPASYTVAKTPGGWKITQWLSHWS